ncbi:hypothetical protein X975_23134, partial [Stegodyphus mimosarum]
MLNVIKKHLLCYVSCMVIFVSLLRILNLVVDICVICSFILILMIIHMCRK